MSADLLYKRCMVIVTQHASQQAAVWQIVIQNKRLEFVYFHSLLKFSVKLNIEQRDLRLRLYFHAQFKPSSARHSVNLRRGVLDCVLVCL